MQSWYFDTRCCLYIVSFRGIESCNSHSVNLIGLLGSNELVHVHVLYKYNQSIMCASHSVRSVSFMDLVNHCLVSLVSRSMAAKQLAKIGLVCFLSTQLKLGRVILRDSCRSNTSSLDPCRTRYLPPPLVSHSYQLVPLPGNYMGTLISSITR